jgi:ribosomal protein L24
MTTLNLPYRIGDQVKATAGKYNGDSGVVTRMTAMEVEVVLEREQKTALC